MSEAPPVEPALIFPIMSAARVRSNVWSLLLNGFMFFIGFTGYRSDSARHRSIVIDVAIIVVGLLFFAMTSLMWLRDHGSQIIILGNRMEVQGGNGKPQVAGLISDIVQLRASQQVTNNRPSSYTVVFRNRRIIVFAANIPNVEILVNLLQQRTGLPFIIKRS